MWFERFVIIVTSLHRDYLPSSWTYVFANVCRYWNFHWNHWFLLCVIFTLLKNFPSDCSSRGKTILKSSGQRYKNIREAGDSLVGTGSDERTSKKPKATRKPKKKKD
jgi:molybdopterin-containing oxidoreductase family membrane subunit